MEQAYPGGDDHGYGFRRGPDSRQAERAVFDGKRMRKPVARKTVDYNASMARYLHQRLFRACGGQRAWNWKRPWLQHSMDSVRNLQIVAHYGSHPANAFTSKFVQLAANKGLRRPVHCVEWSPDARRVWTGSHSGELTVWNGLQFNFESILQAHSQPIRAMTWSHNDDWLLTGDNGGIIKYWQSTMNNVKEIVAHGESVRSISFAPSDLKFVSCSDDRTCKIWDFNTCREEVVFRGHGWDVKSVSWHPRKGIVASGGKDNLIKIWDPKTGNELAALHGHKNTITRVQWNKNGNWFLSSSRDQLLKLWDIRFLKEIESFRGHNADVHSIAWHPLYEGMFASGDFEGTIKFWVADKPDPQGEILAAHESNNGAAVWDMSWHPLGHVLCTASNDQTIKFWTRNRPGDDMIYDKYNVLQLPPEIRDKAVRELQETAHLSSASRQGSLPERIANYQFSGEANVDVAEAKSIPGLGSAGVYMEKIRRRQSNPIPEQFSSMDYLPSSDIDMDRRNDLRDMDRSRSDGINKRSRFDR